MFLGRIVSFHDCLLLCGCIVLVLRIDMSC